MASPSHHIPDFSPHQFLLSQSAEREGIKYPPVWPSFISFLPQISSFAAFWTSPADQQSLGLSIVNLGTGKCSVPELSSCHGQPMAAALVSPGIAQLYEVQRSPAPSSSFPWAGRAHTCADNSTVTNNVSGEHTMLLQVINATQFRSQVRNLVIVICPTISLCCKFGLFYLSLSI